MQGDDVAAVSIPSASSDGSTQRSYVATDGSKLLVTARRETAEAQHLAVMVVASHAF
jgi:hypothetical protein